MQQKCDEMLLVFQTFAFELVEVNSPGYYENTCP